MKLIIERNIETKSICELFLSDSISSNNIIATFPRYTDPIVIWHYLLNKIKSDSNSNEFIELMSSWISSYFKRDFTCSKKNTSSTKIHIFDLIREVVDFLSLDQYNRLKLLLIHNKVGSLTKLTGQVKPIVKKGNTIEFTQRIKRNSFSKLRTSLSKSNSLDHIDYGDIPSHSLMPTVTNIEEKREMINLDNSCVDNLIAEPNKFFDLTVNEIAYKMMVEEFYLFDKISESEFLWYTECHSASKPKSIKESLDQSDYSDKHFELIGMKVCYLKKFINRFNNITSWVISQLYQEYRDDEELIIKRNVIYRLIDIAYFFLINNNFNGVFQIMTVLSSSKAQKIKVFKSLNSIHHTRFEELNEVTSMNSNWKNYRKRLQESTPPVIPFIALITSDLTFIDEVPTLLHDFKINPHKFRLLGTLLDNLKKFKSVNYSNSILLI